MTLKNAEGKWIKRIVKNAEGSGELTVSFQIPADYSQKKVSISIFVGEDYPNHLQHANEGPVDVR